MPEEGLSETGMSETAEGRFPVVDELGCAC